MLGEAWHGLYFTNEETMLISRTEIGKLAKKSNSWAFDRIEKDPTFPKHKKIKKCKGGECQLYDQSEIEAYIKSFELTKKDFKPIGKGNIKLQESSKIYEKFNQQAVEFLSKPLTLEDKTLQKEKIAKAQTKPVKTKTIHLSAE